MTETKYLKTQTSLSRLLNRIHRLVSKPKRDTEAIDKIVHDAYMLGRHDASLGLQGPLVGVCSVTALNCAERLWGRVEDLGDFEDVEAYLIHEFNLLGLRVAQETIYALFPSWPLADTDGLTDPVSLVLSGFAPVSESDATEEQMARVTEAVQGILEQPSDGPRGS